ncbi:hypothetical protein ANN_05251 [Periplaneta americana]|uniref:Uncharacterized protein n=1 Tax=Periplaneta americana TaxID=6978 RepID=A0ABQ8TAJ8_PERAM|nr:hypothetical protein ANN_05251 [Periplaneta americana]
MSNYLKASYAFQLGLLECDLKRSCQRLHTRGSPFRSSSPAYLHIVYTGFKLLCKGDVEYRLIFMEFVEQLDDVELSQGYFQQDGATCHTSNESMELIASFFDDRIISRNLWPPRSPDLTTPDFFLWGYLKDRVYATRPQTLDDLKHNITQEIQAIDNRVLQRVASNMERRVELCLMQDGGHIQHLLQRVKAIRPSLTLNPE